MATLWDIVTGNSTLPVQAGNNFWDHINNQSGGQETVKVINTVRDVYVYSELKVMSATEMNVQLDTAENIISTLHENDVLIKSTNNINVGTDIKVNT